MRNSIVYSCLVAFFLLAVANVSAAQPPDSLWHRTLGGDQPDYGRSVGEVGGGYIAAGFSRSFGGIDYDMYLVRTDENGDTLWARTYGGADDDLANSVRPTSDGGFIIAGYTKSFGAGGSDFYLVKTDSDGDTMWTRTHGGRGEDYAYGVCQGPRGGYLVAGYSDSYSNDNDFLLIKTDASGDSIWIRTYGGSGDDYCFGFDRTADGGCVLVGSSNSFSTPDSDILIVKTDADGDSLWMRTDGSSGNDCGYSVEQTADGGYIVAGTAYLADGSGNQAYLRKVFSTGAFFWSKAYGGSGYEIAFDVEQLPSDCGYIACGYTTSCGGGQEDIYLLRTGADGDTVWTGAYGDSLREWGHEVQQTADGGFIIAGSAMSYPPPAGDNLYLLKTGADPAGIYNPAGADNDGLFLAAIPNPSPAGITIAYHLPRPCRVSIAVFDLMGREVQELTCSKAGPGDHRVYWDACDHAGFRVAPGVYFCRIEAGGVSGTSKLVIAK